jgi:hypothetical protein
MALASQTGEGGGLGVGGVPPPPDPVLFFLHDCNAIHPSENTRANVTIRVLFIAVYCLRTAFKIVVFVFKNN